VGNKSLVIVESPTKAKTIKKFLPDGFVVMASMGHVRDLPQSATAIPPKYKGEAWAKLGVNVDKNFEPLYTVPKGKSKIITELRAALKDAKELYLATDEDREGESISWHLIELLKPKVPVKRMVFHEITKTAIQQALKDCRDVDYKLVSSQETRRILDRLVGYSLSPLIWKKIAYGLSAGRVQSAGLRLLVERERERIRFKKATYWDLKALLEKEKKSFEAKIVTFQGKRVATGKDFDDETGKLRKPDDCVLLNEEMANALFKRLETKPWVVDSIEEKDFTSKPYPPFITSTLQQEANRKLGLPAKQAMRTAQALYEQGLITYMRTDSPALSSQAMNGSRKMIEDLFGKEYLSDAPRQFASKSKQAQEAHEAIRPAGETFVHPADSGLDGIELKLYDLIWKRTLASQMAEAKKKSINAKISSDNTIFAASGMKIVFPGYLRVYVEGKDSPEEALEDQEVLLPNLKEKDVVDLKKLEPLSHQTTPPARFTEASLIQALEKSGIGRPSTYASIISTILDRNYARKVGNALIPSYTGFAVTQLLEEHFEELVDYGFTSQMEQTLDDIAEGKQESVPYLTSFYLGDKGLQAQIAKKDKKIDADEARRIRLFPNQEDSGFELRVGRFGPYVVKKKGKGEEDIRASVPEDVSPSDLTTDKIEEILIVSEKGPQPIGLDPKTGKNIYVLLGRFGPYVQVGEITEEQPKPRRASIPPDISSQHITLDQALFLLTLPRELGPHPETKTTIIANKGRFGPYVQHGDIFRSLRKEDDVFTISFERALEVLAEERKSRRGSTLLKEIGQHPKMKKAIGLYEGKYGPYFKVGTKNFGIPKETNVTALTLEEAIKIIDKKGDDK
jgi:DNA topoisomerase-1